MNGNVKRIPVFTIKVASVSSKTMFIQSCQAVGPDKTAILLENRLPFLCYGVESVSHKLLSPSQLRR